MSYNLVADKLSIYPGIQQIVGLLTIGSNAGKLGLDLIKTVHNLALLIVSESCKQYEYLKNLNNKIVVLNAGNGVENRESRGDKITEK